MKKMIDVDTCKDRIRDYINQEWVCTLKTDIYDDYVICDSRAEYCKIKELEKEG